MDDSQRLELIAEAVRYCQRVSAMGMPRACYSKALREAVHFLWERRMDPKSAIPALRSKNAIGLRHGSREVVYDHAIPFRYLQEELLALPEVNAATLAEVLERFKTVVLTTRADDALLTKRGLAHRMPDNWDRVDCLARYKSVGIELVPTGVPSPACITRS